MNNFAKKSLVVVGASASAVVIAFGGAASASAATHAPKPHHKHGPVHGAHSLCQEPNMPAAACHGAPGVYSFPPAV